MKKILILSLCLISIGVKAQHRPDLQYFRANDQQGLNVFETPKVDTIPYEGVKVRVGGDFAIQFQGINQSNDLNNLVELGSNFNLPTLT